MTEFSTSLVQDAEKTVQSLRERWTNPEGLPPLELAEALEDAANLFIGLSEEISAAYASRRRQ